MDDRGRACDGREVTDWRRLYDLAARQHRVITRAQAVGLGIPGATFDERVRRESWDSPFRGVRVVPGAPSDRRTLACAALAWVGPHATLTRNWAAWLHGLVPMPTSRVELVIPATQRAPRHEQVVVVRSRTLESSDVTLVDGLRTATPLRTLLDLAATSDSERLRELLITAQQRRLTSVDQLAARLLRTGPITGRGRLARVCADLDPAVVDSVFELEVRKRLHRGGYRPSPEPVVITIAGRRIQIDVVFPEHRVGIECDGFGYHSSAADLDRDARRHNLLALDGWTILRLTWQRMTRDWEGFVAELDHALRGAA